MHGFSLLVPLLTFWATFAVSTFAQQNIIQNGGFEVASYDGIDSWIISSGGITMTNDGYNGWGLTLASTSTTEPAGVTQSLNVTTQRTYQLSLWAIYNPPDDDDAADPSQRLLTAQVGLDQHWEIDAPVASWNNFTFDVHGISTGDSLSFTGYDLVGGSFILDNVSLVDSSFLPFTPTPSPSSSSPASDDSIMSRANVLWGVIGSIIGTVASVATIYMCLNRCFHRDRVVARM